MVYFWYGYLWKHFAQNKSFVKQFTDFEEDRLSGKKTDFFYKEVAEPFIKTLKMNSFLRILTCEITKIAPKYW